MVPSVRGVSLWTHSRLNLKKQVIPLNKPAYTKCREQGIKAKSSRCCRGQELNYVKLQIAVMHAAKCTKKKMGFISPCLEKQITSDLGINYQVVGGFKPAALIPDLQTVPHQEPLLCSEIQWVHILLEVYRINPLMTTDHTCWGPVDMQSVKCCTPPTISTKQLNKMYGAE